MLHKVVLTFESAHKILKCDHPNESCREVLSGGAEVILIFAPVNEILQFDIKIRAVKQYCTV